MALGKGQFSFLPRLSLGTKVSDVAAGTIRCFISANGHFLSKVLDLGKDRFFFSAREAASGSLQREKVSDAHCLCSLLRVTQGEARKCPCSEEARLPRPCNAEFRGRWAHSHEKPWSLLEGKG